MDANPKNNPSTSDSSGLESCKILKRTSTNTSDTSSDSDPYKVEYGRNLDDGENDWKESEDESEMQQNSGIRQETAEENDMEEINQCVNEPSTRTTDGSDSREEHGNGAMNHHTGKGEHVAISMEPGYTSPPATSENDNDEMEDISALSPRKGISRVAQTSTNVGTTTTCIDAHDTYEDDLSSSSNYESSSESLPEAPPETVRHQASQTNGEVEVPITSTGTQTFFKQGFLKSSNSGASPNRIRRRHSALNMTTSDQDNSQGTNTTSIWIRVIQWARRPRSKKPSLRAHLQQQGVGAIAPARQSQAPNDQVTFVQAFSDLMYRMCTSTSHLDTRNFTKTEYAYYMFQKLVFGMIAIMSICYSLDLLKYYSLDFIDNGLLSDYVNLGFLLVHAIARIYSVTLHAFQSAKMKKMVKSINAASFGSPNNTNVRNRVYTLGICAFVLAILASLFGSLTFHNWSPEEIVRTRAFEMSHTMGIWSTTDYKNVTMKLESDLYAENIGTAFLLSLPEFLMTFCAYLIDFMLGGFILSSTISLFEITNHHVGNLKASPAVTTSYSDFKRIWDQYQVIARAFDEFYETCGTLLLLYHIYNMLQLAIFLRFMLTKSVGHFLFVTTAVNVITSILTYIIAMKIAEMNQECRNWVRQCAFESLTRRRQKNRKLYMQAILILDEMKDNPLGFGRDELFVNKGFLISLFCMGASIFVLLAEYTVEGGKS